MSTKSTDCLTQYPQCFGESEGTGKSSSGQKKRQRDDRNLIKGAKGLSVQRGQKDRRRDDRDLVEGVKDLSVQRGQKDRRRDDRDLVEGVKGLSVQRGDERPPLHKIVPLSNQLSRNHAPTHHSTCSREQTSSLTSAAPRQRPTKPMQDHPRQTKERGTKAPRPASNSSPLKPLAKAPTKPPARVGRRTTKRDRENSPAPPVVSDKVLRSEARNRGNYALSIIVNEIGAARYHYSLWLIRHNEYETQIISDLVGQPGHYQYRERVGVDPDPGFVAFEVDEIEPRHVHEYRCIVGLPVLVERTGHKATDEWCMLAIMELHERGLIHINNRDHNALYSRIMGLSSGSEGT
jgi:hypothetical protein